MINCGLCNGNHFARFKQQDTAATGTNTATSAGYDNVLNEPNLVASDPDDPLGEVGRVDVEYTVRCQVDVRTASDRLRQTSQGKVTGSRYEITVDRRTLEAQGLLDTNGHSKIRTGAKLDRISNRAGETTMVFEGAETLYVQEITYDAWMDPSFAIVVYTLEPRERAL